MNAPLAAVIQHHSKSFALASRLLPPAVRADVLVLYAWCRRADDTVDLAADPTTGLARLQAELDAVYAGRPAADPLLDAFAQLVRRCALPRHYPQELLAGMAHGSDAGAVRRSRGAGPVLLSGGRRGGSDDVPRDGRGRRRGAGTGGAAGHGHAAHQHLPRRGRGLAARAPVPAVPGAGFCRRGAPCARRWPRPIDADLAARLPAQVRDTLARADAYYRCGMGGIGALDWRCGLAVRAAAGIYRGIGTALARQGYQPLAGRAYLTGWRKAGQVVLALAGQCGAAASARAATRVPARQIEFGPELCL